MIWGDSNVDSDGDPAKNICPYTLEGTLPQRYCESILAPIPSPWSVTWRVNTSEQLYLCQLRKLIPVSFLSVGKS